MNPAEGLRLVNCDVFCCISPIRLAKAAASRVGFETLRRTADVLDFLCGAPRATDVVRSKSLEIWLMLHLDPHLDPRLDARLRLQELLRVRNCGLEKEEYYPGMNLV